MAVLATQVFGDLFMVSSAFSRIQHYKDAVMKHPRAISKVIHLQPHWHSARIFIVYLIVTLMAAISAGPIYNSD